ncbi:MAG TPA: exodeoxyribonuclease VII small subunit [Candidatus Saccharimonadales bacterium]|nr:exodeoxyribonuclease VII small subunit [Candidatus Saccharimonadales bacterium]
MADYRKLSTELDEVINKLQNDDLDIDQAAEVYEKGMNLIQQMEKHLKTVENKVTKIKTKLEKS